MTDEKLESGQEPQETQETPSPAVPSVPSGDKQTSAPPVDAEALARQLAPHLVEALRPEWQKDDQSVKDKRIAGLESNVDALTAQLKAMGVSPDVIAKAQREAAVDIMLKGQQEPVRGGTEGEVKGAMESISAQYLSEAGIAFDDPAYLALVKEYGWINTADNWRAVMKTFVETASTRQAKQASITPAAVIGQASKTETSDDADALAAELERLQHPRPGEPGLSHPDNKQRRKEINARLKELTPQRPDIR
jgi:hypothetical protein